ncbi:MAG: endonuclease/exonuclease/phosphatase family protein [Chromatiales bacterium]|jgi:endonuclease/exonuclease/phosphatase family metal-dependent hydrolase
MKVATYNVHDCIGRDRRFDPARISDVLVELDADVIALQEVTLDHPGALLKRFETTTGMQAIDGSLFARGVGRYGNLLLTRLPVIESTLHDISFRGREPRGVLDVVLQAAAFPVRFCATHLGLAKAERLSQLQQLAKLVDQGTDAAVMLGDFNVWKAAELSAFTAAGFEQLPVRSFPSRLPLVALDRIMVRHPLKIDSCRAHRSQTASRASDHLPVLAQLHPLAHEHQQGVSVTG